MDVLVPKRVLFYCDLAVPVLVGFFYGVLGCWVYPTLVHQGSCGCLHHIDGVGWLDEVGLVVGLFFCLPFVGWPGPLVRVNVPSLDNIDLVLIH